MTIRALPLNKFVADSTSRVFLHPKQKDFAYSDGIENKLLQILRSTQDISSGSEELSQHITSWPTEYHFSPDRANLLRHLPFTTNDDILELGSGCGAITRYLGETGAKITAVEGSLARARCTAERCRDIDNVHVYCSEFQRIDWKQQRFDYILLVGVLEYSPMFFPSSDPMAACLKMALPLLKSHGKLIIAIENRLGLKYFLGASEDHEGKPYVGIEDLYKQNSVKTLGRQELTELLNSAGFESLQYQYPFPDYKLPRLILTEKSLGLNDFKPEDIIRHYSPRDYHRIYTPNFSYELAWSAIAQNKQIADFTNSFLVIASPSSIKEDKILLGISYSHKRRRSLQVKTIFTHTNNKISVEKSKLYPDSHQDKADRILRLGTAQYKLGNHLGHLLYKAHLQKEEASFNHLLTLWLNHLKIRGVATSSRTLETSIMKPSYYDCIPDNLILKGNSVFYIDHEWVCPTQHTFKMQVIRGLYQFQSHHALAQPFFAATVTLPEYVTATLKKYGIIVNNTDFKNFLKIESQFYDLVYGESWRN